jgi:hypothetical protein
MTRGELVLAIQGGTDCELTDNVLMSMTDQELRDHLAEHGATNWGDSSRADYYIRTNGGDWSEDH